MSNGAIRKVAYDTVGPTLTSESITVLEAKEVDGDNSVLVGVGLDSLLTPGDPLPSADEGPAGIGMPLADTDTTGAILVSTASDAIRMVAGNSLDAPAPPGVVETLSVDHVSDSLAGSVATVSTAGIAPAMAAQGGAPDATNAVDSIGVNIFGGSAINTSFDRGASHSDAHALTGPTVENGASVVDVPNTNPGTFGSPGIVIGDDLFAGATAVDGRIKTVMGVEYGGVSNSPATSSGSISGPAPGHSIDLKGVSFANGGSAQLVSSDVLQVVESGKTYDLQLDPSQDYSDNSFRLSSDGNGGTLVTASSGLTINISYDNQAGVPSSLQNAISYVVNYYETLFSNPITVNIDVGYGEVDSQPLGSTALGESISNVESFSYSKVVTALEALPPSGARTSAYANLPGTSPDAGNMLLTTAQAKALGLDPGNSTSLDGWVGFSNTEPFSYTPNATPGLGQYYFVGVAEHEISEVMGRQSFLNSAAFGVMDLFRYSAAGTIQTTTGAPSYFSIDGGNTDLDNWNNYKTGDHNDLGDWAPSAGNDAYDDVSNSGVINEVTQTDLTLMNVLGYTEPACFMAGTMIRTPNGETAVQSLKPGDLVLTVEGRAQTVRWIGRRTISTTFGDPLRVLPIRIRMAALCENVPARDLLLSPDHAVLVDGMLLQAGALVNGVSIVRETEVPPIFTYYHVELDDHALIQAENTPAETFVDNVDRLAFDNWHEHQALYPDGKVINEMGYPRAKAHRQVPRKLREQLANRAENLYGGRSWRAA